MRISPSSFYPFVLYSARSTVWNYSSNDLKVSVVCLILLWIRSHEESGRIVFS
jgi:hypothetical protein